MSISPCPPSPVSDMSPSCDDKAMGRAARCMGRRAREGDESGNEELMSPRLFRVGVGLGRIRGTYPGRKRGVSPRPARRPVAGCELKRPAPTSELCPLPCPGTPEDEVGKCRGDEVAGGATSISVANPDRVESRRLTIPRGLTGCTSD
jgi:hypothetical protein